METEIGSPFTEATSTEHIPTASELERRRTGCRDAEPVADAGRLPGLHRQEVRAARFDDPSHGQRHPPFWAESDRLDGSNGTLSSSSFSLRWLVEVSKTTTTKWPSPPHSTNVGLLVDIPIAAVVVLGVAVVLGSLFSRASMYCCYFGAAAEIEDSHSVATSRALPWRSTAACATSFDTFSWISDSLFRAVGIAMNMTCSLHRIRLYGYSMLRSLQQWRQLLVLRSPLRHLKRCVSGAARLTGCAEGQPRTSSLAAPVG